MNWKVLPAEEKANVLTHGFGLILVLVAGVYFLAESGNQVSKTIFYSMLVFLISASGVYASSTIYHLVQSPRNKRNWRTIDHIAIYLLIGGTYQPFVMMYYEGSGGIIFMSIMWGLILLGAGYKIFFKNSWGWISTIFYLLLGWMVVFIFKPVFDSISMGSLIWLVIGGAAYTGGVVFYKMKRLPYNHAIWHVFVLLGTVAHFISISLDIFNQ